MNDDGPAEVPIDIGRHLANRAKHFPPEHLARYAGQEVAFSADGTRIVTHGTDFLRLWNQLKATGVNPSECVWVAVPEVGEEPL
jgi:hypothetical protein